MEPNNSSDQILTFKEFGLDGFSSTLNKELVFTNNLVDKLCEQYKILDIVSKLTSDYFFQLSLSEDSFKIDWIKGKFEEITGYSKEIITNLQKWVSCIHPDDVHIVINGTEKVLSNQESCTEYRFKSKNGEIKWLRDYTYPVWDEKQKSVTKIIGAVKDITKNKKAEEAIIESEQKLLNYSNELKALNASKDKLFSIISHDLRGPFTGIIGNLELLNESINSFTKEESQNMINDSLKCAKDTYLLLENLLEWARIQIGNSHVEPTNLKLFSLAESAAQLFASAISNKKISIIFDIDKNLQVCADEYMIFSVFRNLISNAVKFSSTSSKIVLSSKSEFDSVTTCVEDNGIGISDKDKKKLFSTHTYYSTQGTDQEKGTGLGLILCKEFVEKNGGRIWVESEIGKGSRFIFTLNNSATHA